MSIQETAHEREPLVEYWNRIREPLLDFYDSQDGTFMTISPRFLGVSDLEKARMGRSPMSTIKPYDLWNVMLMRSGRMEVQHSLWQKDNPADPGYPRSILFFADVERYGDKSWIFAHPRETFASLEHVYHQYSRAFKEHNLPYMSIVTGAGYHILSRVTDPDVIRRIAGLGAFVEPTVQGKQSVVPESSKRDEIVPLGHEQAFKGMVRLQQFVGLEVIRQIGTTSELPINIWDNGPHGIALDNTMACGTVDTRSGGSLGSPYFVKLLLRGMDGVQPVFRVPREGNGYAHTMEDMLEVRGRMDNASRYLKSVDTRVPDGSGAINGLIDAYLQSDLRRLHEAMDVSMGDDPADWDRTYRADGYGAVIKQTENPAVVGYIVGLANDNILKPEHMETVVMEVFRAFGGTKDDPTVAPHVAGFIRAVLEDARFQWGTRWTRHYDAARYARGMVEQILGKMYISS